MRESTEMRAAVYALAAFVAACGSEEKPIDSQSAGGSAGTGGLDGGPGGSGGRSDTGPECSESEDPSRDPLNCGACGTVCPPIEVASPRMAPDGLAVDGQNVYFESGTQVFNAPHDGSAPTVLANLASNVSSVAAMAVDATHLYWTEHGPNGGQGAVRKVPIGGGDAVLLATSEDVLALPAGIAVDESFVYWVDNEDGTVMKVPVSGGTPVTLTTDVYTSTRSAASALVIDESSAYWTADGTIKKVSLSGGSAVEIAPAITSDVGIAVRDGFLYYAYDRWVMRVSVGGGDAGYVAEISETVVDVAVDDTSVYWSSRSGAPEFWVHQAPRGGGTQQLIAANQYAARNLTVFDDSVYWLTGVNLSVANAQPFETAVLRFDMGACQSGACQCPPNFVVCDGTCVDTNRALRDCGGCGAGCSGRQECEDSVCVEAPLPGTGGTAGTDAGDGGPDASADTVADASTDAAVSDAAVSDAAADR